VEGEIEIKMAAPAKVYALDETGKRRNPLEARCENGVLRLNLGGARSPWCEAVSE